VHFLGAFHKNQYLTSAGLYQLSDYPTFGSHMPTRHWSDPNIKYKYGFNGMEKDDDINVNGGSYDFSARIYDSRLSRFLSVDPLFRNYPFSSPYSYAQNRPIDGRDIEGLEWSQSTTTYANGWTETKFTVKIKVVNKSSLTAVEFQAMLSAMKKDAEAIYNIEDHDNKTAYSMDIIFEEVTEVGETDFSLTIIDNVVDDKKAGHAEQNDTKENDIVIVGYKETTDYWGNELVQRPSNGMLGSTNLGATLAHELGHTANAIDPENAFVKNDGKPDPHHNKSKSNLMYPVALSTSRKLNHNQLSNIKDAISAANPCTYAYYPAKPAFPTSPTSGTTSRDQAAQHVVMEKVRIDNPNDTNQNSSSDYVPKTKPNR